MLETVGSSLPLIVLDADGFPSTYWKARGLKVPQGDGETLFIKKGKVINYIAAYGWNDIEAVQKWLSETGA